MKWMAWIVTLLLAFFAGSRFTSTVKRAPEPTGLEADFTRLSHDELQDYLELKDQRAKFEAANRILAKVMQLFVADLGLRANLNDCQIHTGDVQSASETPEKTLTDRLRDTKPAPTPAPTGRADSNARAEKKSPPGRTRGKDSSTNSRVVIAQEKAKGAVHALYQAILWRAPDDGGGSEATRRFSEEGWNTYLRNARAMVQSPEFLKDVEPNHTPQQIINRIYAVYMGRCAFQTELSEHLRTLTSQDPGQVVTSIISRARSNNSEQIFKGGFSPGSCTD